MSFPRYPKYKDSGVEWLGEVPVEWGVVPLKSHFEIVNGSTPSSGEESLWDGEIPWATPSDLSGLKTVFIEETQRTITELGLKSCGTTLVPAGSIVVSTRAPIGSLAIAARELCTNQGCKSLVPNHLVDSKFYAYFLSISTKQLNIRGRGTTFLELSSSELGSFKVPLPALDVQRVVVQFLDRETAKIDALIAAQQRLIELLQEKRQAVISHAVTKGLNPNVPMKDSGIEWLGEVPAHWEVCRVKAVSSFTTSGPRGWSENVGDIGSLFIQSGDLGDTLEVDFLNCKRVQIGPESAIEAERTKLNDGDVLVCVTGAKTGNVAVCNRVPEASYVNQHVCLVRPSVHVIPEFLGMVLKFGYGQTYLSLVQYGLKQGLSLENVRETPVILPPKEEQSKITRFVSHFIKGTSSLVIEAHRAIELLRERRSALISAAVTGQIDVRGLAPKEAA